MSEELKPCPFCGSAARIYDDGDKGGPTYWTVSCASLDCHGMLDHYFPDGPSAKGRAAAIAAWNRRSPVHPEKARRIEGWANDWAGSEGWDALLGDRGWGARGHSGVPVRSSVHRPAARAIRSRHALDAHSGGSSCPR